MHRRLWGLAALFDGVDFAIDGEDEPAVVLLQSLTAATRVEAPGELIAVCRAY